MCSVPPSPDKFEQLRALEEERNRYINEYDYWFSFLHKFWYDNRIEYIRVSEEGFSENGQCDSNDILTYFSWSDYPGEWEKWKENLDYWGAKANEVRERIKKVELGMTEYEISLLSYGWEDKFLDNWETFLK